MTTYPQTKRVDLVEKLFGQTIADPYRRWRSLCCMKKIILLTLVCTGFVATTPFTAQALDSEKIAQYDRDQDRDNEGRATQSCDRLFIVYYRSHDDRKWIYVSKHCNRRAAQGAANRLERRGYRIRIL